MPITDAQVEAFARRFYPDHAHRLHRVVFEELRAAIEAAERAAWSTDMEAAPRDGTEIMALNYDGVLHSRLAWATVDDEKPLRQAWTVLEYVMNEGWSNVEIKNLVCWRPLPLPPETTDAD